MFPATTALDDRRHEARQRANSPALLVAGGRAVSGRITDISSRGARMRLPTEMAAALGTGPAMLSIAGGEMMRVGIRWRSSHEAGLRFEVRRLTAAELAVIAGQRGA